MSDPGNLTEQQLINTREAAAKERTRENREMTASVASKPTVHQYPIDLHQGGKYPHSVIFYINARSNTRVGGTALTQNGANEQFKNAQKNLTADYTAENRVKSEAYNEVAGAAGGLAAFGAAVAATSSGSVAETGSSFGRTVQRVVGGFVGGAVGALSADVSTTVRLLSAIELVTQTPPISAYGASYDQEDLGLAGNLGENSIGNLLAAGKKDAVELAARGAITASAQIPQGLGVSANVGAALEATSKKVANPYREQLFKNMEFRKHSFNYQFAPKNKQELESVMEIIQLFKYHMHPEKSPSKLFLIYPSEFNIEYRYNSIGEADAFALADAGYGTSSRNTYLSKVGTCVLENMRVTYGSGDFVTIKGTQGAPSIINLELTFAEVETLTNDRIGQNYRNSL